MQAFVLLGLRHLIAVDAQNRIVGIITRKDLDHAAGHGWWRMSAQAPKPHRKQPSSKKGAMNRSGPKAGQQGHCAAKRVMTHFCALQRHSQRLVCDNKLLHACIL